MGSGSEYMIADVLRELVAAVRENTAALEKLAEQRDADNNVYDRCMKCGRIEPCGCADELDDDTDDLSGAFSHDSPLRGPLANFAMNKDGRVVSLITGQPMIFNNAHQLGIEALGGPLSTPPLEPTTPGAPPPPLPVELKGFHLTPTPNPQLNVGDTLTVKLPDGEHRWTLTEDGYVKDEPEDSWTREAKLSPGELHPYLPEMGSDGACRVCGLRFSRLHPSQQEGERL